MSKGIVYFVDSKDYKYINELEISIESLRRFHENCPPITLFTNHRNINIDDVDVIKVRHNRYKKFTPKTVNHKRGAKPNRILSLMNSPYEHTLYLDSDTFAICPVLNDIFRLLDSFDIAICHAPLMFGYGLQIPSTFPECNCGMMAYRKSTTQTLFKTWLDLYTERMSGHDQSAFRQALFTSDLRIATMPQQFNWRYDGFPIPKRKRPKNKNKLLKIDWWKRIPMPKLIHNKELQKLYAQGKLEKYCSQYAD